LNEDVAKRGLLYLITLVSTVVFFVRNSCRTYLLRTIRLCGAANIHMKN